MLPKTYAPRKLDCGGRTVVLSRPLIMGVLNVTTDSFSDGGSLFRNGRLDMSLVLARATAMVADGATFIDIGGESTRPGATPVSGQQELDRVIPVVEAIAGELDAVVSVDTSNPIVMREAALAGAGLINDVRALARPGAVDAVVALGLPVCLMHMRGEPSVMQNAPRYRNITEDVIAFLRERVAMLISQGFDSHNILLDPGFGFGKTVEHNLRLLNQLVNLCELGHPVLVGLSRKSMIGKLLGRDVEDRMPASVALALAAVARGAAIVRVHDVRETSDALRMIEAVEQVSTTTDDGSN